MINDSLLLAGICAMLIVLGFWQQKNDEFDLRWLIVDTATKKPSLMKLGQLTALLASTWALIWETRHDHLTEWLFLAYIATWSGVNVANKVVERLKPPPQQESK